MIIKYKLNGVYICNQGIYLENSFLCIRNLQQQVILGTPFLAMLMPMQTSTKGIAARIDGHDIFFKFVSQPIHREINDIILKKNNQINFLQKEVRILNIEEILQKSSLQEKISQIEQNFKEEVCSDLPNAFWDRRKHIVSLPYEKDFDERKIPSKARPSQMKQEYLVMCQNEINNLIDKVINYKPLNEVLMWIRYPMANKKDLLDRLKSIDIGQLLLFLLGIMNGRYAVWSEECTFRISEYYE